VTPESDDTPGNEKELEKTPDLQTDNHESGSKEDPRPKSTDSKSRTREIRYRIDSDSGEESTGEPGEEYDEYRDDADIGLRIKGKANMWLNKSMWHSLLTAQRIKKIEKDIMMLKGLDPSKIKTSGTVAKRHKPPENPNYEVAVKYLNSMQWKNSSGYAVPQSSRSQTSSVIKSDPDVPRAVLEVLQEPQQNKTQWDERQPRSTVVAGEAPPLAPEETSLVRKYIRLSATSS
jgi:hypothetical protein